VRGGITRTLSYDGLDHLVRWTSSVNSQEEWNLYDASGERVLRRTYDGTNTVITVFAFGDEEHGYSYSGSGGSDTNTSNTYYYTLGGQELGTWDGTSPGSPTTNFLLTDTLGSVVSSFNNLPNGAATVLGDQVYGPYGNRRVQQGTISTSKGFTGQFTDFVAGLDYYGARFYDPVVGVFVSADVKQGNMQGIDPYTYVGGNPETKTDPSGNYPIPSSGPEGGDYQGPVNTIADPPASGCGPCHTPAGYIPPPASGRGATVSQASGGTTQTSGWDNTSSSASHISPPKPKQNLFQQLLGTIGSWFSTPPQYLKEEQAGCFPVEAFSFAPQTKVATSKGPQAIVSLHPGENVWSYNPKTHKMELQPIEAVWINHDNDLVDLTMIFTTSAHAGKLAQKKSEVIHTNRKHPFLTVEKGFVPVASLHIGMHIVRAHGSAGVVSAWKAIPGTQAMYNLTVAQDHTFTVGSGQWIVHNDDCMNAILSGEYDPAGLQGASLQEIRARLPANAVGRSFYPSNNIDNGYKWEWTDASGTKWMVEAHAPDANPAAAGGNASQGWIARVSRTIGSSREYADAKGNWYRTSAFDPNSPDYTPGAINDTHIPIDGPGELGGNYPSDFTDPFDSGDMFIP
jgi:RHS repeat-associated protein